MCYVTYYASGNPADKQPEKIPVDLAQAYSGSQEDLFQIFKDCGEDIQKVKVERAHPFR